MIKDKIENAGLYIEIHAGIKIALEYLRNTNFSNLPNGKHEIEGDTIFAIVNEYETAEVGDNLLESHIKYIDVHYITEGIEQIGVTTLINQKAVKLYDDAEDYMLFKEPFDFVTLNKGMFAIFYPADLHMPGIEAGGLSKVKKVVVKVKI